MPIFAPEFFEQLLIDQIPENLRTSLGRPGLASIHNVLSGLTDAIIGHLDHTASPMIVALQNENQELSKKIDTLQALIASEKEERKKSKALKMDEPPEFKGTEDRQKLTEWLNLLSLFFMNQEIDSDKKKILMALYRLKGPAHQYMGSYYDKVRQQKDLGTWDDFVEELEAIYGQRDDKEGAKKEIAQLFNNKDLAAKDFIKYAERFRTLGRITDYDDDLLIDKLLEVIPRDMRLVLAGKDSDSLPEDWMEYLDLLLSIYKMINPEKARGSIFGKSGKDDTVHMDVDTAEKSKSKKGKQVNTSETQQQQKKRFCHICKKSSHNTDDCYLLAKNADKRPSKGTDSKTTERKEQGGGSNSQQKKKKTRVIEVEVSDDEDTSPQSSSALTTARIEEVEDSGSEKSAKAVAKDERRQGKRKASPPKSSDFLQRYL